MEQEQSINLLFSILNEIKQSFEVPVIFLTLKDFGDQVFDIMVHMRAALVENKSKEDVFDILNDLHICWLRSMKEINTFRVNMRGTPRSTVQKALIYTIECLKRRITYLERYAKKSSKLLTRKEQHLLETELEIVHQMMCSTVTVLTQKQLCFQYQADQTEFIIRLNFEVEELLNWVDRLYNNLVVVIGPVIIPNFIEFMPKLASPLKDIMFLSYNQREVETQKHINPDAENYREIYNLSHDLEISKIKDNLNKFYIRYKSLTNNQSAVGLGLQHQITYLEDRLNTLKTMEQSLLDFEKSDIKSKELHIFCHLLPNKERSDLVQTLIKLWRGLLFNEDKRKTKSLLTLLSFSEVKELYIDDYGNFTVDKYGRKLYAIDNILCQLNDRQELVPVNDDDNIYHYDECGRYYLNKSHQRVYKADETASEYILQSNGKLAKYKEIQNGIAFYYDGLGKYYFNNEGKQIYRDDDDEEYENDGLGNLIRLRSINIEYNTCPQEIKIETTESKYLKQEVGTALKICISEVLIKQPTDPLQYLAERLINFRRNIADKQKRQDFETELQAERQIQPIEITPEVIREEGEGECSYVDNNMKNYMGWTSESSIS